MWGLPYVCTVLGPGLWDLCGDCGGAGDESIEQERRFWYNICVVKAFSRRSVVKVLQILETKFLDEHEVTS